MQLNQDDVHAGGDLAVGAIVHHAGDGASEGCRRKGEEQADARERALQRATPTRHCHSEERGAQIARPLVFLREESLLLWSQKRREILRFTAPARPKAARPEGGCAQNGTIDVIAKPDHQFPALGPAGTARPRTAASERGSVPGFSVTRSISASTSAASVSRVCFICS